MERVSGFDFIGSIRGYAQSLTFPPRATPEPEETDELIRDSELPDESLDDVE
jgi:hypothetical protein